MTPDMTTLPVADRREKILALIPLPYEDMMPHCYNESPLATILPRSGHMTGRITWVDATLWLAKSPDHVGEAAAPTWSALTAHE